MASDLTQLEILKMLKCFLEFLLMCFFVGPCHLDLHQLPGILIQSLFIHILDLRLKVSKFQNEFMKSSLLPKYEQNIVRISALYYATLQGRNPYNFWFIFWETL